VSRRKTRVIEHGRCALRVKRSAASGCCVLPRRCASAALTQPHRLDHALTAGGHDLSLRYGAQVDRLRAHMQKQQELKKSLENRPTVPYVSLMCTPGLGSPLPHLHRDWARPCHICTGTGLAPCHICTGTAPGRGSPHATSAPGRGSPLPHLQWDGAHPYHSAARPSACSARPFSSESIRYVVQFGDTLQGVALRHNMNPGQLKTLNKLMATQVGELAPHRHVPCGTFCCVLRTHRKRERGRRARMRPPTHTCAATCREDHPRLCE